MTDAYRKLVNRAMYSKVSAALKEQDKQAFNTVIKGLSLPEAFMAMRFLLNAKLSDPVNTLKKLIAHPYWAANCANRDRDFTTYGREFGIQYGEAA